MKKLLTILFLTIITNFAYAVDLIVPTKAGGTMHKFSTIIVDELAKQNIEVNMILSGNCVQAKKLWQNNKEAILMNAEATQIVEGCDIAIDNKNYGTNLFTTDWRLVSKDGVIGKKLGVVSMMKHIFADQNAKIVPYANTSELDAALLAGEVDSIFTVVSKSQKEGYTATKLIDIQLNYYLLQKGNVANIINLLETNKTLISIGDKKGIKPIRYNSVNDQVEYLNRNEETWR